MKVLRVDGKTISTERIAKLLIEAEESLEGTASSFLRELTLSIQNIKKKDKLNPLPHDYELDN